MENKKDKFENVEYISLNESFFIENDETTYLNINIGSKDFVIGVTNEESNTEYSKFSGLSEAQYPVVDSIVALRKLAKFLELSIDIGFTKDALN